MTKCQHCDADILSTSQPTASELAPCPFCGASDAFAEREDFTSAYVTCNHCSARGPVECQESDDEETPGKSSAEISWNTRLSRTSQPNRMGTTPEMQKMYDEFGGEALMTSDPAPEPCSDLSISELLEWLWNPQWTNGFLDSYAEHHMSSAAKLIEKLLGVLAAQPASPLRGITDEMVLAAAKFSNPLAWEVIDEGGEYMLDDRAREVTLNETREILTAAFSASPPEQPAADPYPSFAERNLIDRFGRHLKEQPAADQVTSTKEDYHD